MRIMLGLAIIVLCLAASVIHLEQNALTYYDFVGFVMVLGGTLAVGMMIIPVSKWKQFKAVFKMAFVSPLRHRKLVLVKCNEFVKLAQVSPRLPELVVPGLAGQILKEGAELINLGLKQDSIEIILSERIHFFKQEGFAIANSVRSLAKYPPAFGLAGTVLGLVHLMRGISGGMDPAETGTRMAIALVATFYGLLVANVFVSPVGDVIHKSIVDEVGLADMALQCVMLASERIQPLEAQELLNSYVPEPERLGLDALESAA